MKEQIADYVMDGEVVLLQAGSHSFLSIYMQADQQPAKGTVIIIHGRGYHPNWPELIYPLRTGLTQYGWNTLSIQMPVLDNEATFYDYLDIMNEAHPRIDAAVAFLQKNKMKNIVLLAHSCGVHMAIDWLEKNPQKKVHAFIGIGMGSTDYGQPMLEPFPLEMFSLPILDIRGENDYPSVIRNAPRRLLRMQQAGNKKSQQVSIADANHYFTDHSEALLTEIVKWLNKLKK